MRNMVPSSTTTTSDRANSRSSSSCLRGHWRHGEDEKLRQLVEQYGPQNWNSIAEKFEGRSGKSCRLRWFNQLNPRINRRPFTAAEEERLLQAHRAHGNRWALISRLFPGRTDNAVKNHWHVVMARRRRHSHHHSSGTHLAGAVCSHPPRRPPPEYFHFSAPPAAAWTTGSLCFAMPGSVSSGRLSSSGAFSVRNRNVPTTVAFSSSREEVEAAPEDDRHDMSKDHVSNGDNGEDGGGAAAAKRKDVPFFDFLGVGI